MNFTQFLLKLSTMQHLLYFSLLVFFCPLALALDKEILEKRKLQEIIDKNTPDAFIFAENFTYFVDNVLTTEDDEEKFDVFARNSNVSYFKVLLIDTTLRNATLNATEKIDFISNQTELILEDIENLLETANANGTVACGVEKIKVDLEYHDEGEKTFKVSFSMLIVQE